MLEQYFSHGAAAVFLQKERYFNIESGLSSFQAIILGVQHGKIKENWLS